LPAEEVQARLKAIGRGPWSKGLVQARESLGPAEPVGFAVRSARLLTLDDIPLSAANRRKIQKLRPMLMPHFRVPEGITKPKHIEVRNALDQALTLPQLWELAVQTGYLPASAVRMPARQVLTDLLWSPPAREFVHAYDYLSVPLLANRVGIVGVGSVNPPDPNPHAALHFAGFLAHLRAFHEDEPIDTWIGFLDDYVVEDDEQEKLWEYLRGKRQDAPVRLDELLGGCADFVSSLASAFDVLSDNELRAFGLLHAYWLQKFFGYDRDANGMFVKNIEVWGRTDSWAQTVMSSPRLVPDGTDPAIASLIRRQFQQRVQLLERTFQAVRNVARSTRVAAARLSYAKQVEQPSVY
jgi:hypothetical protein